MLLAIFLIVTIQGTFVDVAAETSTEKRLLLHSDDDIASELMTLKAKQAATTKQLATTNQQLATTTKQLEAVLAKVISLEMTQQNADHGAVYTRWGRNACASDVGLIYHGYIAGKKWNEYGSTSTNLCLPYTPTWANYTDGVDHLRGGIYGTEIDFSDTSHIFPYTVNDNDLPCAVCKSTRKTSMMIPARTDCYPGWTLEYTGYLASAMVYSDRSSYDTVCLDSLPEFVPHGGTNDNEHVLYLVEARCGSLPCPPYVNGRELACAVCTI